MTMLCTPEGYVNEEQICQAAVAMWARIGLKVALQLSPRAVATQRRVARQFDITPLGWANEPAIDALSLLVQVVHTNTGANGLFDWGGWGSAGTRQADRRGRQRARHRPSAWRWRAGRWQAAGDDILFLPLHQQPMAWAMRSNVAHVLQLPDNKVRLWMTRMGS